MDQQRHEPVAPIKWAVSIATILIATSLAALAAAPYSWLGNNYAASAVASLILLAIVSGILAYRRTWLVLVPCLLAMFPALLLLSSGLFLQAVGTIGVCLVTIFMPQRVRLRIGACIAVMLLAYVPMFQDARESDARFDRMRAEYPLESLRDRLPPAAGVTIEPVSLSSAQKSYLVEIDREEAPWRRSYASQLEQIHSDSYQQFARTPNFGMLRMGPVSEYRIGREYELVIDKPAALPQRLSDKADEASPRDLHHSTELTFLDKNRLGYVKDVDNVAGFVGHGFSRLPYDDGWERDRERTGRWTLRRLDLIGLVTHDHPVAYVTERLPDMEELGDAPTRELTEFEATALRQLRQEKDIVVEDDTEGDADAGPSRLVMVGALRAGESCATCHSVPYGTLLGAFSYDLVREAAPESGQTTADGEP